MSTPSSILIKPIVTEKALADQARGKYHFHVGSDATKSQIATSFFQLFKTKVLSVTTKTTKGRTKMNWKTRQKIHLGAIKSAIITVDKSAKIDILSFDKK